MEWVLGVAMGILFSVGCYLFYDLGYKRGLLDFPKKLNRPQISCVIR